MGGGGEDLLQEQLVFGKLFSWHVNQASCKALLLAWSRVQVVLDHECRGTSLVIAR